MAGVFISPLPVRKQSRTSTRFFRDIKQFSVNARIDDNRLQLVKGSGEVAHLPNGKMFVVFGVEKMKRLKIISQ